MLSGRRNSSIESRQLRSLSEENGLKLINHIHVSHLFDCIPLLSMQDKEKVCGELKGTLISCFDC